MAFRASTQKLGKIHQQRTIHMGQQLLDSNKFMDQTMTEKIKSPKIPNVQRGAFIVFEGCDRCGKSTQSQMLGEFN